MKARSLLPWVGLAVVLLGVAVVAGAPSTQSNRPLDPRATGPLGAKGVVDLLEELGADVDITRGAPSDEVTTALVLREQFDADDRAAVRAWTDGGGVLVVADPGSTLNNAGLDTSCPEALDDVNTLALGPGASARIDRGRNCFDGFVVAAEAGDGDVISIGDPRLFTNQFLDDEDNAVLAAALLAPTGSERVAFVEGRAGSGERRLFDLLGPRAAQSIGQLAVAAGIYVLWRGRRLGRPVVEGQPVSIAGSELVAAVGRMLGSRHRPAEAADAVRADLRRALELRLGLPAGASGERLAAAVASRTGLDPGWVANALASRPIASDGDLVAVLSDLDRIRDLVLQPTTIGGTRP